MIKLKKKLTCHIEHYFLFNFIFTFACSPGDTSFGSPDSNLPPNPPKTIENEINSLIQNLEKEEAKLERIENEINNLENNYNSSQSENDKQALLDALNKDDYKNAKSRVEQSRQALLGKLNSDEVKNNQKFEEQKQTQNNKQQNQNERNTHYEDLKDDIKNNIPIDPNKTEKFNFKNILNSQTTDFSIAKLKKLFEFLKNKTLLSFKFIYALFDTFHYLKRYFKDLDNLKK